MDIVRRLRVHGRVQGVGFRAFVLREASVHGVHGWVRNCSDGTVEALVRGDQTTVDDLIERIREGPRWGHVDRIEVTVESDVGEWQRGFHVRSDR